MTDTHSDRVDQLLAVCRTTPESAPLEEVLDLLTEPGKRNCAIECLRLLEDAGTHLPVGSVVAGCDLETARRHTTVRL